MFAPPTKPFKEFIFFSFLSFIKRNSCFIYEDRSRESSRIINDWFVADLSKRNKKTARKGVAIAIGFGDHVEGDTEATGIAKRLQQHHQRYGWISYMRVELITL